VGEAQPEVPCDQPNLHKNDQLAVLEYCKTMHNKHNALENKFTLVSLPEENEC